MKAIICTKYGPPINMTWFFDTVGKANIPKTVNTIKPNGRYLHSVTTPETALIIWWHLLGKPVGFVGGSYTGDEGHKRGNVVVQVNGY